MKLGTHAYYHDDNRHLHYYGACPLSQRYYIYYIIYMYHRDGITRKGDKIEMGYMKHPMN